MLSPNDEFILSHIHTLLTNQWAVAISILSSTPNTKPPEWLSDSSSSQCTQCHTPFNLINRRHHCRCCGCLACSRCTTHKLDVPKFGLYSSRVCNSCFIICRTVSLAENAIKNGTIDVHEELENAKQGQGNINAPYQQQQGHSREYSMSESLNFPVNSRSMAGSISTSNANGAMGMSANQQPRQSLLFNSPTFSLAQSQDGGRLNRALTMAELPGYFPLDNVRINPMTIPVISRRTSVTQSQLGNNNNNNSNRNPLPSRKNTIML